CLERAQVREGFLAHQVEDFARSVVGDTHRLACAGSESFALLGCKPSGHSEIIAAHANSRQYPKTRLLEASSPFECENCFPHRSHVVNADNLHALHGKAEGGANRGIGSVGFLVADQLAKETLAGVADEERAAEFVELVAVLH